MPPWWQRRSEILSRETRRPAPRAVTLPPHLAGYPLPVHHNNSRVLRRSADLPLAAGHALDNEPPACAPGCIDTVSRSPGLPCVAVSPCHATCALPVLVRARRQHSCDAGPAPCDGTPDAAVPSDSGAPCCCVHACPAAWREPGAGTSAVGAVALQRHQPPRSQTRHGGGTAATSPATDEHGGRCSPSAGPPAGFHARHAEHGQRALAWPPCAGRGRHRYHRQSVSCTSCLVQMPSASPSRRPGSPLWRQLPADNIAPTGTAHTRPPTHFPCRSHNPLSATCPRKTRAETPGIGPNSPLVARCATSKLARQKVAVVKRTRSTE